MAIKNFIDDISSLAIEQSLIKHLPSLLSSDTAHEMDEEAVHSLVSESPAVAEARRRYSEKLDVLEAGMYELRKLTRAGNGMLRYAFVDSKAS